MKINRNPAFSPVIITLETREEVRILFACLTRETSSIENRHRVFMHDLSHLLSENTNVFNREQS